MSSIGINIQDFGAVGDNVTDDTAAIQHAIDQAQGFPVFIPPRRFRITRKLSVTNTPVNLIGAGSTGMGPGPAAVTTDKVSVINATFDGDSALEFTGLHPCTVRGIQFRSSALKSTGNSAIRIVGADATGSPATNAGSIIENCGFVDFHSPIQIVRGAQHNITGNRFSNWIDKAIRNETTVGVEGSPGYIDKNWFFGNETGQQTAIYSETGYITIDNNHILNGVKGVELSIKHGPAGRPVVVDNIMENQRHSSILVSSQDGSVCSMLRISRNEISNVEFASRAAAAICIQAFGSLINHAPWISDFDIEDNILRSQMPTDSRYIWVQSGQRFGVSRNRIVNLGSGNPLGIQIGDDMNSQELIPAAAPNNYEQQVLIFDNPISGTNRKHNFAPSLAVTSRLL